MLSIFLPLNSQVFREHLYNDSAFSVEYYRRYGKKVRISTKKRRVLHLAKFYLLTSSTLKLRACWYSEQAEI